MSRSIHSYQRYYLVGIVLLVTLLGFQSLQAQSFDYKSHPKLDFDFRSLNLELGIQPQNLRIDGSVTYSVEANVSGADTLTLFASHIDVRNVTVGDEAVEYSLQNDSLLIPVTDSTEIGNRYQIAIRYSGRPQFGLLKNSSGTVWTSMLPKTQRHWVPIIDNPQVDMKTEMTFSVPGDRQVWATGQKMTEKTGSESEGVKQYKFTSQKQVPASSLSFAIGSFEEQSTTYGIKRINVAVEQSLSDSVDTKNLLEKAYNYLEKAERKLQHEFPYSRLNVIVTGDHSWETKSWGASTVFLYADQQSIDTQLMRGIVGQWFGVLQREGQWSQADAISLYQTIIADELLNDSSLKLDSQTSPDLSFRTVYEKFGGKRWNQWQQNINTWQEPSVRSVIFEASTKLLNALPPVISWDDYADYWYQQTGQPLFDLPRLREMNDINKKSTAGDTTYNVFYDLNEAEGELKLRFESTGNSYSTLVSVEAHEVYSDKIEATTVTFTGVQDSVIIKVDPLINTLRLKTPKHPELKLNSMKPAPFLIYDFRNGETANARAEAARKLGYHRENADLQLAIRDFMNQELKPKVRAALLSSFANITNGAEGTQQVFLDALNTDQKVLQEAGFKGLQNFSGNAEISARVQSIAKKTSNFALFESAAKTLRAMTSGDKFGRFAASITSQDTTGAKSIFILQQLADMGNTEQAVRQANKFTNSTYDYSVRKSAIELLAAYDQSVESWMSRAEKLLDAPDPRIRFLTVQALQKYSNDEVRTFLSERIADEYDARVYKKIRQVLQ
ncbi:HEAT repeat-containing protein [Fodinibius salinus]|uniref:HEAT repeat-containing protein n=1 Tax=Fodinibius salinus TaxID=860790 RepID=A0A5D3YMC7_9BACT|nr:M1 family metallopeptidase [Fodinibius salinus]TYP94912.1 HEAT repeat-containing protein [Fodinibius salinus]